MERIQMIKKRGRIFKYVFIVMFASAPVLPVLSWMFYNDLPEAMRLQMAGNFPVAGTFCLALNQRILASAAGFLVSLITMAGLFYLIRLFSLYEKGIIFSSANVEYYRKLGYIIIISMFAGIIHNSAMSVILSLQNPPGNRIITLSLSSSEIAIGIIGMIVVLISWIMDAGREMKEEQEYTV